MTTCEKIYDSNRDAYNTMRGIGFVFRGRANLYIRGLLKPIKPDALHLWLLHSKSGGLKWFLCCARERGRNDCRRIQIKCDVCISHWVSTGVMWMFLSMMGFVSRRPTAFIKLLDIQIYRWNHFLQTDAHWWHLQLFGHPGKSCFGLVFHLKSAVRGAETPCFQNIASI